MRRVLRIVVRLVVLATIMAGIVVGGAYSLPDMARIERHIAVPVQAERLKPLMLELRGLESWLSWKEQAPDLTWKASGALAGTGQRLEWTSTSELFGSGALVTTTADGVSITATLNGGKIKDGTMRIALAPVEGGTGITWMIAMPNTTLAERWERYFTFERDFAPSMVRSLANLKSLAEQEQ